MSFTQDSASNIIVFVAPLGQRESLALSVWQCNRLRLQGTYVKARSRFIGKKPSSLEDVVDYISKTTIGKVTLAIDFTPSSTRKIYTNRVDEGKTSDSPAFRPCINSSRRVLHTVHHELTGNTDRTSVFYGLHVCRRSHPHHLHSENSLLHNCIRELPQHHTPELYRVKNNYQHRQVCTTVYEARKAVSVVVVDAMVCGCL